MQVADAKLVRCKDLQLDSRLVDVVGLHLKPPARAMVFSFAEGGSGHRRCRPGDYQDRSPPRLDVDRDGVWPAATSTRRFEPR